MDMETKREKPIKLLPNLTCEMFLPNLTCEMFLPNLTISLYVCVHKNEIYSDVSPLQRATRNCFCWLFECHFNNSLPQIEARRLCA